jgi:phytoene synthase
MTVAMPMEQRSSRREEHQTAELLRDISDRTMEDGSPRVPLTGQLLRPFIARFGTDPVTAETDAFWCGVLAVQLAHEASLIHDDVVDRATVRRGAPTVFASRGIAGALLEGDHLLTAAFRAAAATGSTAFVQQFARSVERTVAAEKLQGQRRGNALDEAACDAIASGKTGELFACALATGALVNGSDEAPDLLTLGREIGVAYQFMDDFFDYCRSVDTGKAPLGDFAERHWTWVLCNVPGANFEQGSDAILSALHEPRVEWKETSAFERIAAKLDERLVRLRDKCTHQLGLQCDLENLFEDWRARVQAACERERSERCALTSLAIEQRVACSVGVTPDYRGLLARNAVSFRFASRLLPVPEFETIARVYAFCRLTDNIVDEPAPDPADGVAPWPGARETLSRWVDVARKSYAGQPSGIQVVDAAMRDMAQAAIPFMYVEDMAGAMLMDIAGTSYETLTDLHIYTHGVAGVVGLWIARLGGVSDAQALAKAERLGHAMQLTNIIRDVGEDRLMGRCYLPTAIMLKHGVTHGYIDSVLFGGAEITQAYRAMTEELLCIADRYYADAFRSIPALPVELRRCMAVAAYVYRGINDAVRSNGYDNIRQRARTSFISKVRLAFSALAELRAAGNVRRHKVAPIVTTETIPGWSEGHG